MKPSSARTTHALLRSNRPQQQLNDARPPMAGIDHSPDFKNRAQAWPETPADLSREGNHFNTLRSPINSNNQYSVSKDLRGKAEKPTNLSETYSANNLTSPTGLRFQQGTANYSPNVKQSGRSTYAQELGNNELPSSLDRGHNRNDNEPKDYIKLEKEIIDLKNEILGRLHNPKTTQRPNVKTDSRESSSSSSSPEETKRRNRTQGDNPRGYDKNKGSKKSKNDSKIKIYDEEDTLVEEPIVPEINEKKLKEEGKIIDRTIDGLSMALKKKEKKYLDLKAKFKEMKGILKGYVNRVIDLEDTLKKKDEMLNGCEEQIKNDQKKLQKSNDLIQELKIREEALQKSEGNAIDLSVEYKSKYLEQKEELKNLRNRLAEMEDKFKPQLQSFTQENAELLRELEITRGREISIKEKYEKNFVEMEDELNAKENLLQRLESERDERESQMKALREELERVRNERDRFERKFDESSKARQEIEVELMKSKRKNEEELQKMAEESERELISKKEKIKRLKEQVGEYERLANKAAEENKFAGFEADKLMAQKTAAEREAIKTKEDLKVANKEITTLKASLDSLKIQFNETFESLRAESTRSEATQNDVKKVSKQLKLTETKLSLRERDLEKYEDLTNKLKGEVKTLLEENTKSREYISKLEDRVSFLQMHQSEEITKVEAKIEEFYREIYALREENKTLNATGVALTREIEVITEERDQLRKDYQEMKHSNKSLEKELRALNRNMKEVINEKMMELSHHSRGLSSHLEKDAKLEVFDEVQDMIKNHRQSARRFEG